LRVICCSTCVVSSVFIGVSARCVGILVCALPTGRAGIISDCKIVPMTELVVQSPMVVGLSAGFWWRARHHANAGPHVFWRAPRHVSACRYQRFNRIERIRFGTALRIPRTCRGGARWNGYSECGCHQRRDKTLTHKRPLPLFPPHGLAGFARVANCPLARCDLRRTAGKAHIPG
jgi:hypothetical protein